MFCTTERTRDEAEVNCAAGGMHLIHVSGIAEELWLYDTAVAGGMTEDFWSGGVDLGSHEWAWADGAHFWSGVADGTPVDDAFAHFRKGEPNGSGGCVLMQTDHLWDDQDCLWTRKYVCEASGSSDTIIPYDCTMPVPLNSTCRAVGSSTDLFFDEEVGFDVARMVCRSAGMHLVRIEDSTEDQAVRTVADELGIESYFADGSDREVEGQWRWSDAAQTVFWTAPASGGAGGSGGSLGGGAGGSSAGGASGGVPATGGASTAGTAYVNWAPAQPNNSGNCLRVTAGPAWDDVDCVAQRYVCERP